MYDITSQAKPVEEIDDEEVERELQRINNEREQEQEAEFIIGKTSKDIFAMNLQPIKYDIGGLVMLQQINIIAAHPESYKTLNMYLWGEAFASGKALYNKYGVNKKRGVVFISGETEETATSHSLHTLQMKPRENYYHMNKDGDKVNFLNESYRRKFIEWCKDKYIEIIFIDSLVEFLRDYNDSDPKQVMELMGALREFVKAGLTPIVIHHNNKGAGTKASDYSTGDHYRGSTTVKGAVRMMWAVSAERDTETGKTNCISFINTKNQYCERHYPFELEVKNDEEENTLTFTQKDGLSRYTIFNDTLVELITNNAGISKTELLEKMKELKESKGLVGVNADNIKTSTQRLESDGIIEMYVMKLKNKQCFYITGKAPQNIFDLIK